MCTHILATLLRFCFTFFTSRGSNNEAAEFAAGFDAINQIDLRHDPSSWRRPASHIFFLRGSSVATSTTKIPSSATRGKSVCPRWQLLNTCGTTIMSDYAPSYVVYENSISGTKKRLNRNAIPPSSPTPIPKN